MNIELLRYLFYIVLLLNPCLVVARIGAARAASASEAAARSEEVRGTAVLPFGGRYLLHSAFPLSQLQLVEDANATESEEAATANVATAAAAAESAAVVAMAASRKAERAAAAAVAAALRAAAEATTIRSASTSHATARNASVAAETTPPQATTIPAQRAAAAARFRDGEDSALLNLAKPSDANRKDHRSRKKRRHNRKAKELDVEGHQNTSKPFEVEAGESATDVAVGDADDQAQAGVGLAVVGVGLLLCCWCIGATTIAGYVVRESPSMPATVRERSSRCIRSGVSCGTYVVGTTTGAVTGVVGSVLAIPSTAYEVGSGNTSSGTRRWIQI